MKLWLVCFVVLFLGAEGLQGLGQMPGLAAGELGLPWIVLGGIGLAIASNYRHRQPHPLPPKVPQEPTEMEPAAVATGASGVASTPRPSSISFEIRKPQA